MREFNREKRQELKRLARKGVELRAGQVIGIQYLGTLIVGVPAFAVVGYLMFTALRYSSFMDSAAGGADPTLMFSMLYTFFGKIMLCTALTMLISVFLGAIVNIGMMRYWINIVKSRSARVSDLFCAFPERRYWMAVRMTICLSFRSFLWMIVPNLIFSMLTTQMSMMGTTPSVTAYIAYYLVIALISIKVMTYTAGWIWLLEGRCTGAWEASREGSRLFKGQLFNLLVFELSFMPWYLLAALIYLVIVTVIVIAVVTVNNIALTAILLTAGVLGWLAFLFYVSAYVSVAFLHYCYYLRDGDAPAAVEQIVEEDGARAVEGDTSYLPLEHPTDEEAR